MMVDQVKMIGRAKGFVLAAPHSGAGKTTLSIGLMRALSRRGVSVVPAKVGPDYIDPQFHSVACGVPSLNLDGWAMSEACLAGLGRYMAGIGLGTKDMTGGDAAVLERLCVIEGVMGLFDGAVKQGVLGHGATCDIARFFNLPVVLVVDCAGMGQSVAALVKGFAEFDPSIKIAGVILNKLGSLRHVEMMERALAEIGMPVIGAVPRFKEMVLPSRHLGLVQPEEFADIDQQIDLIADHVEGHVKLEMIEALAGLMAQGHICETEMTGGAGSSGQPLILGQHVAVAEDEAFRFFYPHLKRSWAEAQVSMSFFSPLNDEAPDLRADAIYLPGGYPELHAGRLAGNEKFMGGLRQAAEAGRVVYGECGGYMTLGAGLIDKDGQRHRMAGLLPLETSFEKRKLHLGYRHVKRIDGQCFRGHEFHYASVEHEEGQALFEDVDGPLSFGLQAGAVSGSFVHLIDGAQA